MMNKNLNQSSFFCDREKLRSKNQLVHSIDRAFDEMNFAQIKLPAENKTYEIEIEAKKKKRPRS